MPAYSVLLSRWPGVVGWGGHWDWRSGGGDRSMGYRKNAWCPWYARGQSPNLGAAVCLDRWQSVAAGGTPCQKGGRLGAAFQQGRPRASNDDVVGWPKWHGPCRGRRQLWVAAAGGGGVCVRALVVAGLMHGGGAVREPCVLTYSSHCNV